MAPSDPSPFGFAQSDSTLQLNASMISMSSESASSALSVGIGSGSGKPRARDYKYQSQSHPVKHKAWLFLVAILCCLSTLNFVKEASRVERGQWNSGAAYLSRMQEQFVSDFIDLAVLEEVGEDLMQELPKPKRYTTQQPRPAHARHDANYVPLHQYIHQAHSCPDGLTPAPITSNPVADLGQGRKIPFIVHQTGKTACLTDPFLDGARQWTLPGHSFYFHDDQAVWNLLHRDWPMFPQLNNTLHCLKNAGGAAIADLWRYLVLWEYGGIYTDMDNLPGELFNETTISPDTDAFFLQERGGWLSQYFFAVSPKHPIMFLAIHDVMHYMHSLLDTGTFYVPQVTGPGATKRAFCAFLGIDERSGATQQQVEFCSKPNKDIYVGYGNRTVTVEGTRQNNGLWCKRSAIGGHYKKKGWKLMNITNYQELNKHPTGKSCVLHLHDHYATIHHRDYILNNRRW